MTKLAWAIFAVAARLAATSLGFEPRDYTFLLTADASTDPAQIVISWPQQKGGEIAIRRKLASDQQWGSVIATLPADATLFVDTDIRKGLAYDYEVSALMNDQDESAAANPGLKAYGYVRAGAEIPVVEDRGKVALMVDDRFVNELATELAALRRDLIGDGWMVVRHDVSRDDSPTEVKALIKADYETDREEMRAVFLFGHVPVPYSGLLDPDMHGEH